MCTPRGPAALLAGLLVAASVAIQAQPPRPTFGTRTAAVIVDAVVRDRQGRPITDLTLKDFEIYEDGVRQQIGALSMIAPNVRFSRSPTASGPALSRCVISPVVREKLDKSANQETNST